MSLYSLLLRVTHSFSDGWYMVGPSCIVHTSAILVHGTWFVHGWYMAGLSCIVHSAILVYGLKMDGTWLAHFVQYTLVKVLSMVGTWMVKCTIGTWLAPLVQYTVLFWYICACPLFWYMVLLQCSPIQTRQTNIPHHWTVPPKYTFTSKMFEVSIKIMPKKREFVGQLSELYVARETKSN